VRTSFRDREVRRKLYSIPFASLVSCHRNREFYLLSEPADFLTEFLSFRVVVLPGDGIGVVS
jgi:hypothetical protein